MAIMADAVCGMAVAVVAHFLGVGGMITASLSWVVDLTLGAASTRSVPSTRWLPLVRQQLLDPTVQLCRQPSENVLQVSP